MGQDSPLLPIIAFIGGISAASTMVIVASLALSQMALNYILLPASYPDPAVDTYRWRLWGRRLLIGNPVTGIACIAQNPRHENNPVVRDHNDNIAIDSEPGRGTRVTVHLPLRSSEQNEAPTLD